MNSKRDRRKIRNPESPILFVDDDPIAHTLVRHQLKNWDVTGVYTAREALAALEDKNFVIVITDLMMPEMDGIDLLHAIKSKYRNRVQVIVVTASDQLDHLTRALEGGANDFLLKPLETEELEEVLEYALSKIDRWNRAMKLLVSRKKGN